MIPAQAHDVPVVRLGLGRILIGWDRVIPVEGVVIPIEGGHVTVDPARPEALPACLVTDADAAAEPVLALYGEDAASALQRLAADDAVAQASCSVDADEALEHLGRVSRLGMIRWCRAFSPLPLDEALLWLEELTLVGQLWAVLDDVDDWAEDLERACGWVVDRAGDHVGAHPDAERLLIDALEVLATTLPVTDPISSQARERLSGHDAAAPKPGSAPRSRWVAEPPATLALAAGDSVTEGVATVDWFDVRRGTTSMDEDNVRWALELEPTAAVLSVAVAGPPPVRAYGQPVAERERPAIERLAFDAYVPGWPFAVLTGELAFDDETWSWSGSSRVGMAQATLLHETLDAGGRPSVRVRALTPEPAQNPAWAMAHRWACRALALARVSGDAAERAAAADTWRRAADLWRLADRDAEGDACGQLAVDALAEDRSYELTVAETWLVEAP